MAKLNHGHVDTVAKHELQEVEDLEMDDFIIFDTTKCVASDVVHQSTSFQLSDPVVPTWYATLTDEKITAIAQAWLAQHMKSQTKWSVMLCTLNIYILKKFAIVTVSRILLFFFL